MEAVKEKRKHDIIVKFKPSHFLHPYNDDECLLVSFANLYDLFNLDALDTGLPRSFSLIRKQPLPVGILDPQMLSLGVLNNARQSAVDYLWNKVLYFDSMRSESHDYSTLKGVINKAYEKANLKQGGCNPTHAPKTACHQQRPGNACGFYAAYDRKVIMGKTNLECPEDLNVPSDPLDESMLSSIREELATFLVSQVINKKGEFYYANPAL